MFVYLLPNKCIYVQYFFQVAEAMEVDKVSF